MVKGWVWHWHAAPLESPPAEPSGPAGGGSSVRLKDARTHVCTHEHTRAHKGLHQVSSSLHCKARHGKAAAPQPCPGTTRETDRRTDRQAAPPGSRTDRRTASPPRAGAAGRAGSLPPAPHPPPPAPPAAHRLPAGSIWWKIRARGCAAEAAPRCGAREGLRGRGDTPGLAMPAPSRHPAPSSASLCLVTHCVPVRLLREINVVEFISTDGGQFSSSHLTDTSCTSLCQCPCAADNLYGEQVYYAVFILPAPLQIEFISPHLGEFRFSKQEKET